MISFAKWDKTGCSLFVVFHVQLALFELNGDSPI
jgi:hypothetical protein